MLKRMLLVVALSILGYLFIACIPGSLQNATAELQDNSTNPARINGGASDIATKVPISDKATGADFQSTPTKLPGSDPTNPVEVLKPTQTALLDKICSPLAEHPIDILPDIISDPYNPPPPGKDGRHMGVDFSYYHWQDRDTIAGVAIQTILPGRIVAVFENHIPYGYAVMVETPLAVIPENWLRKLDYQNTESLYTMYAHMAQKSDLQPGINVHCGDSLGVVGQTGGEDTPYAIPHLHLEMRFGRPGSVFTDLGFYDTRISEEARQNYQLWRTSGEFRHFDPMILISNYLEPGGLP